MKIDKTLIKKVSITFAIITLMLSLAYMYNKILTKHTQIEKSKIEILFENIENNVAYLNLHTIYGNHLNIDGYIPANLILDIQVKDIKLVLMDMDKNETEYDLKYSLKDENYIFKLSDNINKGVNLEAIPSNKYFFFLKVIQQNEEIENIKYYSIKNLSEYENNEYYTLTSNQENRKIDLFFDEYLKGEILLDTMQMKVTNTTLPNNVYDIVIDAGHGGRDPGAMHNGMKEAPLTLEYSIKLKEKLEDLGYKVKLTREKDEYVESYGKNARATTGYETKAKLVLSIHLNSTIIQNPQGGVEVYVPNKCDLTFAKNFVDNIVTYTGTKYSPNNIARVLDGVYVRTYSQAEVEDAIQYAHDIGYTPYENLTTETPYLFMTRETGGIMTRAYIDGRNKNLGDNPYRNSNIAPEAYLLELGFINAQSDIENLLKNQDNYINAIVDTIVNNYKLQ